MIEIPAYQQRVVDERHELDEKCGKLAAFIDTDACRALDCEASSLLIRQLASMNEYSEILRERLALWGL